MQLARVIGAVVATIKYEGLEGEPTGRYTIAVDAVDAGAGEIVLILDEGNSARQVVRMDPAPIRAVVVGIVDELTVEGEFI